MVQHWLDIFPADMFRGSDMRSGAIYSPRDLARLLHVRHAAKSLPTTRIGPTFPCDLFLFGIGEPPVREATKVGGLPYRPARKKWPLRRDGVPMTFLAQFCFAESRDIAGTLPGDVLLVFIREHDLYWPDDSEQEPLFQFEWYDLGLTHLIAENAVPPPEWTFVKCFGYRFRTEAWLTDLARDSVAKVVDAAIDDRYRYMVTSTASDICSIDGVKIGGVPVWYCPPVEAPQPLGRFLCSLTSIVPPMESEYRWVNRPYSSTEPDYEKDILMWRDGEVINFFIDEENEIHWAATFC